MGLVNIYMSNRKYGAVVREKKKKHLKIKQQALRKVSKDKGDKQ